jgi:hypothetical protein
MCPLDTDTQQENANGDLAENRCETESDFAEPPVLLESARFSMTFWIEITFMAITRSSGGTLYQCRPLPWTPAPIIDPENIAYQAYSWCGKYTVDASNQKREKLP